MSSFTITREFYLEILAQCRHQHHITRSGDPLATETFPLTIPIAAEPPITELANSDDGVADTEIEDDSDNVGPVALLFATDEAALYRHMTKQALPSCSYIVGVNDRGQPISCNKEAMNSRAPYCIGHHKECHAPKTPKMSLSEKVLYGDTTTAPSPVNFNGRRPEFEAAW
jgi:hypothetical protein